ncbi:MAG: hypothetical protein ABUS79_13545, partial [Pseudomonadota bacterium]
VAAAGGPAEPWMAWIDRFHQLMRRALQARARGSGDDAFERAVLSPPDGRMLPVVVAAVAAAFGELHDRVAATLFPSRRPRA